MSEKFYLVLGTRVCSDIPDAIALFKDKDDADKFIKSKDERLKNYFQDTLVIKTMIAE